MNLFEAVKDAVPARAAAERYGIEVKRNGMACCPFHDDKNPSLKVDTRFHCFGCQEDGDVIDFVGKLFDLSPKRAAEKLAEDFEVRYDGLQMWRPQERPSVLSKLEAAREYRKTDVTVRCAIISTCSVTGRSGTRRSPRTGTGIPCSVKPYRTSTISSICWMNCSPALWRNAPPSSGKRKGSWTGWSGGSPDFPRAGAAIRIGMAH